MPMFTTVRIRWPVCPVHVPDRTCSANAPMRSSTACTSATTSVPSTTSDAPRGMRSATCSTGRSSVRLMCSPRNIASTWLAQVAGVGERREPRDRLVGDAVLRVVEVPARDLGVHVVAARRVRVEQVAQVLRADGRRVRFERAPLREIDERSHQNSRGSRSYFAMPPHRQ